MGRRRRKVIQGLRRKRRRREGKGLMEREIEDRDTGIRWREGERGDNREWGRVCEAEDR